MFSYHLVSKFTKAFRSHVDLSTLSGCEHKPNSHYTRSGWQYHLLPKRSYIKGDVAYSDLLGAMNFFA